jgi:butyrate kinase
MTEALLRILIIDPGATSTKLALFEGPGEGPAEGVVEVASEVRRDTRVAVAVHDFVVRHSLGPGRVDAVAARGGLLPPLESGTWRVDDAMVADLRAATRGVHASNQGASVALELAGAIGVPAFVVDPVSIDELVPEARLSGLAPVPRESLFHALNVRAVARRFARSQGARLEDLSLVVAHLGTGVSVAALVGGRAIDVVNPRDEGPFSPDRCGGVPAIGLLDWLERSGIPFDAARRRLFGEGGLYGYLGTRDLDQVEAMLDAREQEPGLLDPQGGWPVRSGDGTQPGTALFAGVVWRAMVLQIAKATAEMTVSCHAFGPGRLDAILLTGGMARSKRLLHDLHPRIAHLGPVYDMPGEDELRALAEGAFRVLAGREEAKSYAGRQATS